MDPGAAGCRLCSGSTKRTQARSGRSERQAGGGLRPSGPVPGARRVRVGEPGA